MLACQNPQPETSPSLVTRMVYQVLETMKASVDVSILKTKNLICYVSSFLVTTVWTAHGASRGPKHEKDFRQTNKLSLRQRATTAKGQRAFR